MRTLSHLLPQTPHGHAAHRAVAARLHSSLAGITSDDRIAGLVLQAVLPRGGGGGYGGSAAASGMWSAALAGAAGRGSDAAAGRSYARMHASARRLVSCIRSAYPGVEEIEPFTGVLTAAPRAARADTQEAPSKLRWLRPLQRSADGVGAVEPYDGGVLGPADARTAARDVLTRTLTRRRKAAPDDAHAQPSRFATLVSRVAPAPLPCIPEDDPDAARESHGSEDLGEEELLQRELRRAGAQRLLGLADGRLGPAEEARQQLEARGPLAAMLPVLQAMLARCLSAQDLGFEAGEVCKPCQRSGAICVVRSSGCHRLAMPYTFARCKCACIRTHEKRACMRKVISAASPYVSCGNCGHRPHLTVQQIFMWCLEVMYMA